MVNKALAAAGIAAALAGGLWMLEPDRPRTEQQLREQLVKEQTEQLVDSRDTDLERYDRAREDAINSETTRRDLGEIHSDPEPRRLRLRP